MVPIMRSAYAFCWSVSQVAVKPNDPAGRKVTGAWATAWLSETAHAPNDVTSLAGRAWHV